MINYLQDQINSFMGKCEFVSPDRMHTKTLEISFVGWGDKYLKMDAQNEAWTEIMIMVEMNLKRIVQLYESNYNFFQPELRWHPDRNSVSIRISLLEITLA